MIPNIKSDCTYDEAFAALEAVLAQLEDGDLPLEKALELYEEGMALASVCQARLSAAELRVRQYQVADAGGDQARPFTGWQDQ